MKTPLNSLFLDSTLISLEKKPLAAANYRLATISYSIIYVSRTKAHDYHHEMKYENELHNLHIEYFSFSLQDKLPSVRNYFT